MKIIIIEGDINNAITGFRKELVKSLVLSGHEVILSGFIAYKDNKSQVGSLPNQCSSRVVELGLLSMNPLFFFKSIRKLFQLLKTEHPSVCLAFNIRPLVILGLINYFIKIPSIGTITGTSTLRNEVSLNLLPKFLSKVLLRNYKTLFFQNEFDQSFFKILNLKNVLLKVVPGSGVDTNFFSNNKEDGIMHEVPKSDFLLVSRLIKQKGILEYIDAARQVKKKYPNLIFGILGPFYQNSKSNNSISTEVIKKAEEEGLIKYYGTSNDVKLFMLASSCVVLPSYGEGMSNSLLEAASLEKPILASNVPGCKEIVDDGVTGFLFESRSTSALVIAIQKFLVLDESQRIQMGVNGRLKMCNQFEKILVVNRYLNEINSLLK